MFGDSHIEKFRFDFKADESPLETIAMNFPTSSLNQLLEGTEVNNNMYNGMGIGYKVNEHQGKLYYYLERRRLEITP